MAFTNSPLVDYTLISPNKTVGRNHAIDMITIHCTGSGHTTVEKLGNGFHNPSRGASSNYGIGSDGRIGMYVEEKDRSWCTSSGDNDHRAITIEVSSEGTHPYKTKDVCIEACIKLCADICKRNNIKALLWKGDASLLYQVDKQNMSVHRWLAAKACVPTWSEVLTKEGWKALENVEIGDEIACATLDGLSIVFKPVEDIVPIKDQDTYTCNGFTATKDHRMVYSMDREENKEYLIQHYGDLLALGTPSHVYIPLAGNNNEANALDLTRAQMAFIMALQADGSYDRRENGEISRITFHFSKERKIERLRKILDKLGYIYQESNSPNDGTKYFRIKTDDNPDLIPSIEGKYLDNKKFTWEWLNMSGEQADFFFNELMLWDGCAAANSYCSYERQNLDVVSAIAAINGRGSAVVESQSSVSIYKNPHMTLSKEVKRNSKNRDKEGNTRVSCITIETGIFLCRQNGKTFIIGNCPGEYIYNKLTYIANEVNRRIGSNIVNPQVSLNDNPNQKASKSSSSSGKSSTNSQGSGGLAANVASGVLSAALQASYTMSMGRKSSFSPYDDGSKMAKIKNARTNRAGTASQLYNKIKAVDTYIGQGHDTTSFITFSVNGFQLDTRAQNSFDHYAISLENTKTGVGQGNKFKLIIAYHKHFSNYSDINKLEQALGPLRQGSTMVNNFSTTRTNLTKNVCSLTYGYNASDNQLVSPTYVGLLLKYTVTADKQIVTYVLEGYTGEQVSVNTVNWYPNIVGMKQTTTGKLEQVALGTLDLKNSPNKPSDEQMRELIKELNTQYSGGITFQPYLALDCFLQDYNASIAQSGGTQYYLLDCTSQKRGRLSDENTLEPVHLSLCRGQTPIQYIEYCISLFKYKQTTNYAIQYLEQSGETSERFVYEFVRDPDTPQIMYICVDVIDSSDSDSKVAYTFTGYSTDNNLLIDYNLNYDGTVALALSDSIDANNEDLNAIYIDSNGQLRAKQSITRDMFVFGEIEDVVVAKQNTWIDKVSIANQCTMRTFGLPFEISVGTVFKCGIYITDTLHHSSGNCFVTGMVDRIENNSFTTDFTMIRLPGRNSAIKD